MKNPSQLPREGILSWFARNSVAANLLMMAVVVTGLVVATQIRQEVYPTYQLDTVEIRMDYRGASPEEVEHSVVIPIESELRGLEFVRRIEATASEGRARVVIEVRPSFDRNRALQDVTAAVQRISLFPDEVEPPVISLGDGRRRSVMSIAVYGDVDERALVDLARELENGLLAEPEISLVEVRGARRPEVLVEVPQEQLRALGLTLQEVADAIEDTAVDVPAGTLRSEGGDILLRTTERREFASEFDQVPVVTTKAGSKVFLGDIATVRDGFEESENETYFDGRRSVSIGVYSAENQSPITVAKAVRRFIEKMEPNLPPSVGLTLSRDRSIEYRERIELLLTNGAVGLLLVLLALGLLLELRVAFWTAIGIPVSILGSLILLPAMGGTINMISLFGFIVTLGIVVDDAVVVGEDIFHKISQGKARMEAAVEGVKEMTLPVFFAVSTNIIAFLPLLFVPGQNGRFFQVLPAVVIAVFVVSLVECLLILPSHLAFSHKRPDGSRRRESWFAAFDRRQSVFREKFDHAIERLYRPVLDLVINHRLVTVSGFLAALVIAGAYLASGRISFTFRPSIETDFIQAEIELPSGTPVERTREVVFQIEEAGKRAIAATGEDDIVVGISMEVADGASNKGEVAVTLVSQSQRQVTSKEFASLWREQLPTIPDLESIFFDYIYGPGGEAEIDIELMHPEVDTLRHAAAEVAEQVGLYPGVKDVRKGFGREMPQFNIEMKPAGQALGITSRELGRQIRNAYYGAEAIRQPRGREEVRVMVRLPERDRRSLASLEELLVRAPGGGEIPLGEAATVTPATAPMRIERVDGGRILNVTANVVPGENTGNAVLGAMQEDSLPRILARYPGLRYRFEGEQREQREAMRELGWGLLASLFAIYAIMASLLRSYKDAFVILLTIPWSLAGAVLGHVLLGYGLSVFSIFGMIALCGMVVNGGFVLAVTRNRLIASGHSIRDANIYAAQRRFRPLVLTALTTFLGLLPMIFETSLQALFLVPMAISLGIGTLASSVVILLLIPAVFALGDEAKERATDLLASGNEEQLPGTG